ncbi:hypothetical protein L1049_006352 [Liquidambar formosana]|uniref:Glucan endo-1,3-beta-D-glucosidase n=1 Tax=Liquidambar formosana TaxID=63359 RepID=A0AAP0RFD9_LIQFO
MLRVLNSKREGTLFNKVTTKDIPCVLYCGRRGGIAIALYGEKCVLQNLPSIQQSNSRQQFSLVDAAASVGIKPFSGIGIELMIGVPNEILPSLASSTVDSSLEWLQTNIFAHVPADQIRYIAVGNEIFLKDPFYTPYVIPAITNLHQALQTLNLADTIKLSSALAASILSNSYPPSSGTFNPNLRASMVPLLQFLQYSGSPLMVNVYPYISYTGNPNSLYMQWRGKGSSECQWWWRRRVGRRRVAEGRVWRMRGLIITMPLQGY